MWHPTQPFVANRRAPRSAASLDGRSFEATSPVAAELAVLPTWGVRLAAVSSTASVP